jgi:hypothetical protein
LVKDVFQFTANGGSLGYFWSMTFIFGKTPFSTDADDESDNDNDGEKEKTSLPNLNESVLTILF